MLIIWVVGHLRIKHIFDAIYRSVQHEASDEKTDQHRVREHRGEIHHLYREIEKHTTFIFQYVYQTSFLTN